MIPDAELLINLIKYHEDKLEEIERYINDLNFPPLDMNWRQKQKEKHEEWLDYLHRIV